MHKQGAFAGTDSVKTDCPVTERLCETVLSLPMHPYLKEEEQAMIVKSLLEAL